MPSKDVLTLNPELKRGKRSKYEIMLESQLRAADLMEFIDVEYRFDDERKWRLDFAIIHQHIAIEVDGGNRMAAINPRTGKPVAVGRHTQSDDYRKLNRAAELGWRVLRFTPEMIESGEALETISRVLLPF